MYDPIKRFCYYVSLVFVVTIDSLLGFFRPLLHREYFSQCTAAEISYMQNKEVSKRAVAFKNAALGDFRISHHLLNLYCTW